MIHLLVLWQQFDFWPAPPFSSLPQTYTPVWELSILPTFIMYFLWTRPSTRDSESGKMVSAPQGTCRLEERHRNTQKPTSTCWKSAQTSPVQPRISMIPTTDSTLCLNWAFPGYRLPLCPDSSIRVPGRLHRTDVFRMVSQPYQIQPPPLEHIS